MNKLLLVAAGVIALSGCDFAGNSDAVNASISSLQVTNLPVTSDEDGSAPDVFFEIQNAAGRSYFRTAVVENADLSAPVVGAVTEEIELISGTQPLYIAAYDFDGTLRESSLMARSAVFTSDEVEAAGDLTIGAMDGANAAQFTVSR